VTTVHVRPMSDAATVLSLDSVARTDWSGLVVNRECSTNNVPSTTARARTVLLSSAERTIQYAAAQYGDLLRKLAD